MSESIERRDCFKILGMIPFLALPEAAAAMRMPQEAAPSGKAEFVGKGKDRTNLPVAMGFSSLGCKVSGEQTRGGLFLMEHVGLAKGGGPPRHLHYEQEEWFYVLEGEIVAEVGNQRFRLKQGDSVFAPRRIPHTYLYVAEKPGRLLIAFTPAGKMEAFFRDGHKFDPEFFAKYELKFIGPGLTLEEAARV
ncbi:MAG TPA: cupin domain-containing protein [Candidatus Acidoferrum sp.]|nr:cupin domain-containing protein [Candidatus Acidoferrum sp.]